MEWNKKNEWATTLSYRWGQAKDEEDKIRNTMSYKKQKHKSVSRDS